MATRSTSTSSKTAPKATVKKPATKRAPKKAVIKKVAAKKTGTKVTAKKTGTKKVAAKKVTAKKAGAKKVTAKKATERPTAAKAAPKAAPTKAAAPKAAPAKRAPANKNADKAPAKERVLITGICGALGRMAAVKLHRRAQVIGVDHRGFADRPRDVEHHRLDLRRKSALALLKKKRPTTIIHLGVIRNPSKHKGNGSAYEINVEAMTRLIELSAAAGVKKFVFLSTSNLYGPNAKSGSFLTEDAPLHGADRSPEIRDLVALDMMTQSLFWKHPQIETVILRPVHIVGPTLRNAPSRFLRMDPMPTLMGFDPMLQLVHADDVIAAMLLALKPGMRGIYNIVGPGQLPLSRVVTARGKGSTPYPEPLLRMAAERSFRYGLSTYPPGELDHLKFSCLVDGTRAETELGYRPARTLEETVLAP